MELRSRSARKEPRSDRALSPATQVVLSSLVAGGNRRACDTIRVI